MRIRSSIVDGHAFTRVRRGYAAAEVDAVMARIADTLRDYEEQTDQLEARIAAAATAARVAKPRNDESRAELEAAERYASEIVRRAEEEVAARRAEITSLLNAARREAEELRVEAERARSEVESERSGLAAHADSVTERAHAVLADADRDADAVRTTARTQAEELLESAIAEAQRLRAEATAEARELRAHAEDVKASRLADLDDELEAARAARHEQERRSEEASARADAELAAAREERGALEARIADLRSTVDMIERQMRTLAGEIIHRAGGADAERETLGLFTTAPETEFQAPAADAPPATAEPHAVHVDDGAPHGAAVAAGDAHNGLFDETQTSVRHHAYAEPDGSGRPPADRTTVVPDVADGSLLEDDQEDPYRTVYQRAGRNLRARLRQEGQDPTQRGR